MPASDVYAWAKASTKPTYNVNEITGAQPTLTAGTGIKIENGVISLDLQQAESQTF